MLEVSLGRRYIGEIADKKRGYRLVARGLIASLSEIGRRIGAPWIRFPKLIRDVRKILGHSTLALDHFSPFPLLVVSALQIGRRGIHAQCA